MRKKIYSMVHVYDSGRLSRAYKWFMIIVIVISLVPLTTKNPSIDFDTLYQICLAIYISDYIMRWISADYKFNKHHWTSFAKYPFRFISIIDLMSIIALLCPLCGWLKYSSATTVFAVFRIIRIFRYSKGIQTIIDIFKKSKKTLIAVGTLSGGYVLISALIIFNVEPQTFNTFFDAVYWATVSLTTVGYGDIYPVSDIGRFISMLSSFFGIAIVALPSGVVTAEYLKTLNKEQ